MNDLYDHNGGCLICVASRRAQATRGAVFAAALAASLSSALRADPAFVQPPRGAKDQEAKIFRPINHFMVDGKLTEYRLSQTPLPFVDWSLVQAGFIEYLNKATGDIIPLKGTHNLTSPDEVEAVPFAIPRGIELAVQRPRLGGSFDDFYPPPADRPHRGEVHTILFDDSDRLYKVWYANGSGLALSTSPDLKTWTDVKARTSDGATWTVMHVVNVSELLDKKIMKEESDAKMSSPNSIFVDPSAPPAQRYKCTFMARLYEGNVAYGAAHGMPVSDMTSDSSTVMFGATSPDGLSWTVLEKPLMLHDADTFTVTLWDAEAWRYVMYTRLWELGRRTVARAVTKDFRNWPLPDTIIGPGSDQSPTEEYYEDACSLYPGNPQLRLSFVLNYHREYDGATVRLATSRDGLIFHMTPGPNIIEHSEPGSDVNGFLMPVPGLMRTQDGRMILFYCAYKHPHKFPRYKFESRVQHIAEWPADRLVALEARNQGEFTTPPLKLEGTKINLNLSAPPQGGIQVELRDEKFNQIPGFTFADADTLTGDHAKLAVTWRGQSDVSSLKGQSIHLRFKMRGAKLFAVSAE